MTEVSAYFYVVQVIYFTLAATLFGIFAHFFRKEVQLNGWGLTPRWIRSFCLLCSSFGFLVVHLDSFGALGFYSDPWQLAVGHITASMLVGSVCASLYMYVLISFKGETVPLVVIRLWVASNMGGFVIVFILSMLVTFTNNYFWSFLGSCTLMLQEIFLYFGFLIIVHKTTQMLRAMTQTTDYGTQIRKLWKSWIFASIVIAVALTNQSLNVRAKAKWGAPVPVTNYSVFEGKMILPDLILLAGHLVLLFMLRPPSNNKRNSKHTTLARIRLDTTTDSRTDSKASSTSSPMSSPMSATDTLASRGEANNISRGEANISRGEANPTYPATAATYSAAASSSEEMANSKSSSQVELCVTVP